MTARLRDRLLKRYRTKAVFLDHESIGPGERFNDVALSRVLSSDAVLVVIGRQWLVAEDATGRRRIFDDNDYVRREIAAALHGRMLVVPVLVDGATMPSMGEIPEDLEALLERNAVEIRTTTFESDVKKLLETLPRQLRDQPRARPLSAILAICLVGAAVVYFWRYNESTLTADEYRARVAESCVHAFNQGATIAAAEPEGSMLQFDIDIMTEQLATLRVISAPSEIQEAHTNILNLLNQRIRLLELAQRQLDPMATLTEHDRLAGEANQVYTSLGISECVNE